MALFVTRVFTQEDNVTEILNKGSDNAWSITSQELYATKTTMFF